MADPGRHALWVDETNVDPASLPLTRATRAALVAWATTYDATLDPEHPSDAAFADPDEEDAWREEGERLHDALERELGPAWRIEHPDCVRHQAA